MRGRLLIGADGVHSAVRASVFGAGRPEFTGCMAWRGVIPVERLGRDRMPLAGTNWIGPGRHVVHYPLRRGELLNFVGVVERGDWLDRVVDGAGHARRMPAPTSPAGTPTCAR